MGACAVDKTGNLPLPDETIEAALNSDAIAFRRDQPPQV